MIYVWGCTFCCTLCAILISISFHYLGIRLLMTFNTRVSVFSSFSSGMPIILQQFLLEYCSISSTSCHLINSCRRKAISHTNTPARAFLKLSLLYIIEIVCLKRLIKQFTMNSCPLSILTNDIQIAEHLTRILYITE